MKVKIKVEINLFDIENIVDENVVKIEEEVLSIV